MNKLIFPFYLNFQLALVLALPITAVATRQSPDEFVIYKCQFTSVTEYERLLNGLIADDEPREIFVDKEKNRLCLRASANSHNLAKSLLEKLDVPKLTQGDPPNLPAENERGNHQFRPLPEPNDFQVGNLKRRPEQIAMITRFVSIGHSRMQSTESELLSIFENKTAVEHLPSGRSRYVIRLSNIKEKLEFEFDPYRNGVLISGPEPAVVQLSKLLESMSVKPRDGFRTRVINVRRRNQNQVYQLISPQIKLPADSKPVGSDASGKRESSFRVRQASFLSGYKWQDVATQDEEKQEEPEPQVRQFEDVEIETLPELDVIILRGRDKDLDQLEEIIRQIERISRETQPEIRIVDLKHTGSQAISTIITESRQDLVGGRQGRVSVIPLVKPNALLLIGWGDAVEVLVELARELDKPVDASTQFRVFRIKHATADTIGTSIESFFDSRGGLGPQVSIAVDTRSNSLVVYSPPRDMEEVARLIEQLDVTGSQAVNQTKIIKLQNSLASDVAQTLEEAISAAQANNRSAIMELSAFDNKGIQILYSGSLADTQITPNLRNNTLIVSSPKESIGLIEELIRQIDTPLSQSQLKIFKVYNGDAANIIQTLRSLIPGSVSGAANLKLPTAPDEISLVPLRFSVDTRSNSILAAGSEGDLIIVEALITKLDETTSSPRQTEVYQLKNSPAVDVANAINQFLQSSRQIEGAIPGEQSPFQELDREVVIVPEPIANKLLLSATPKYFREISELIEKLDEQPAQVVIQVLIAEVLLNDADEFGIEVGLQDSVLFDRSLIENLITTQNSSSLSTPAGVVTTVQEIIRSATNIPGFNFNSLGPLGNSGSTQSVDSGSTLGAQGISNFAVGRSNDQLGFGGLVLSANNQNVSVLIRALQESRRIEILSRPQIRTLDNQPAFIQVGQRVPRIIGSTINQNGQSNSVALENVGLILGVTPRIGPDGTVVMEIDAEKSNLGAEQDGIPIAVSNDGTIIRSPRVDTTTAQATVSAANGETIVLGGLITNKTQKISRHVPGLSRIPVLKHFFKYDSYQKRRTELLIILTPRVIRSASDNAKNRELETSRMSWCAADVFNMHGNADLINGITPEQLEIEAPEVIYPVENPRGSVNPQTQEIPPARIGTTDDR